MYAVFCMAFVPVLLGLLYYVVRQRKKIRSMEGMMENVPGGFFYYSADEKETFEYISPEVCQIFGCTEAEFRQMTQNRFSLMIYEPDRQWALEEIDRQIESDGRNDKVIYRIMDKNGEIHWLDDRGRLIADSAGKKWFYVAVLDITEQMRMKEEMIATKELLRMALENTDICEFYYYPQERIVINPERTCRLYHVGERCEGVPGNNAYPDMEPKYRERFDRMFRELSRGEKTASCVVKIKEEGHWCKFTLSNISSDRNGKPQFAVGVVENITKQKNAERENSELQSIYRFTVEREYDGIGIVNLPDLTIDMKFSGHFNSKELAGISRADRLREKLAELFIIPEEKGRFLKITELKSLKAVLGNNNEIWHYVFKVRCGGEEPRHKEISICYFDEARTRIFLCMRDIEDMIQKEERGKQALLDAYDEVKRANEAKTDFLSKMSHDIRTPMNAIIGMTAIAETHLDEPERIRDCLNKIKISSKLLLRLINEILDMSKIESGKVSLTLEEFNLTGLIDDILDTVRTSIEAKQQELLVDIGKLEHPCVLGDSLRIQKIFMNLMSNAVKYTPAGGTLKLIVRELPCYKEKTGCYRFIFEDTGIGMSEDFMEHLFEPFSRAEDSRVSRTEGTGLGMAITKNIVRMMNGDIQVESALSKGSRFTVTIYLTTREQAETEDDTTVEQMLSGEKIFNGKRALLAEDNELNMEIAREILGSMGLEIETAVNGKEAVDMFECSREYYYDLVLMDIQMPVMNGNEAAVAIRALDREDGSKIPIIAMTANAFIEDVELTANSGMNDHIAKPIDIRRLTNVLKKWLFKD